MKTTINDLHLLTEKLVQTCIKFINDNGLNDIDEINFKVDSLQISTKYGHWVPDSDACLSAYEMENRKRKFLGEVM